MHPYQVRAILSAMMDGVLSTESLWLAPPAADMQTIAAQGHGGVPGRFEWQV